MTQTATVEQKLERGQVLLSVARQSACGHDCEKCAGCGVLAGSLRVKAEDTIGDLEVGEKVLVTTSNRQVILIAAMVYLIPIVAFLIGYASGDSLARSGGVYQQGIHAAITLLLTAVGFLPAVWYDRRLKKQNGVTFQIVGRM